MKVYVELSYTIALEVGLDEYEATTEKELLDAIRDSSEFAYRINNGPHVVYDHDWRIPDLWGHTRREYDDLGDKGDGFEVLVRRQP